MDMIDFLRNPKVKNITESYQAVGIKRDHAAFNLFSLSTYHAHRENFHSDIIASLLDSDAAHREGALFLQLFIEYLSRHFNTLLEPANFSDAVVTRETGRLDLWIRDEVSKKAIIIENKINNAVDMDAQLDRYFNYSHDKGYDTSAIIYLSMDSLKLAPKTTADISHLVKHVGASCDTAADLVNGWLTPCLRQSTNDDSRSFIHQYINLLKHLGNHQMENNTMNEFYQFLCEGNGLETVRSINEMNNRLPSYRAQQFATAIGENLGTFYKRFLYKSNYWLFEYYKVNDCKLKLDVWFDENGGANVVFWNTTKQTVDGRAELTGVLEKINWEKSFDEEIGFASNGYMKRFVIGMVHSNMLAVDEAVAKFVKEFLNALNEL